MAIVYNPYAEMLREPALLTPRKQPVGRVKIDWSLGITNKMRFCWDASQPIDLVSGSRWENYGGSSDVQIVTGDNGVRAAIFTGNDAMRFPSAQDHLVSLSAGLTLITLCNVTRVGTIISNRYDNDCNFQFYTGSSSPYFNIRIGDHYVENPTTGPSDGTLITAAAVVQSGGVFNTYIDNVSVHSDTNTGTPETPSLDGIIVGARGTATSPPGWAWDSKIYRVFMWDRALSDAERTALWLDPYQFLIPA